MPKQARTPTQAPAASLSPAPDWAAAPALILSGPGPAQAYMAALVPAAQFAPTQSLLGWEAQILGFIAANSSARCPPIAIAPMPEIFDSAQHLAASLSAALGIAIAAKDCRQILHLRFGSPRLACLLKPARNLIALAEYETRALAPALHPLTDGLTLPAHADGLVLLPPHRAPPPIRRLGSGEGGIATFALPADDPTTDLGAQEAPGLDLMTLADLGGDPWQAAPPALATPAPGPPLIGLTFNLADPVSAVADLLPRLFRLAGARFRPVLLPYNTRGAAAKLQELRHRIRTNTTPGFTADLFAATLAARALGAPAIAALRAAMKLVLVDGNDPEHRVSLHRLRAAGFTARLLTAAPTAPDDIACHDRAAVTEASQFGTLTHMAALPFPIDLAAAIDTALAATP